VIDSARRDHRVGGTDDRIRAAISIDLTKYTGVEATPMAPAR
jgi:hypothetical protein